MDQVLVLNTGSSSIKYQLFEMSNQRVLVSGTLEGIGEAQSKLTHRPEGVEPLTFDDPVADHPAGFTVIRAAFERSGGMPTELAVIGHRVVHGGDKFSAPAVIDDTVLAAIDDLTPLAPLHNPSNLVGIRLARELYPDVPQVAVFDTAFHSTMPETAYRYALPEEVTGRLGIRRYGFHGTSHDYVSRIAAEHLGRPLAELKLITLHLGNGASVAAIDGGRSVDTSMGMTPLEGLVMGSRSGDLDPAVVLYLQREGDLSVDEVDSLLNRQSGLKGLAGSNDVRELTRRAESGDATARLALDIFCYRIRKYIGAYAIVLGRLDGLIFTAGVGENSSWVRSQVCAGLKVLGIKLDPAHPSNPTQHPSNPTQHGSDPDPDQHPSNPTQHGSDPDPDQHPSNPTQHGSDPDQHPSDPDRHPSNPTQHGSDPDQHPSDPDRHPSDPRQHPSDAGPAKNPPRSSGTHEAPAWTVSAPDSDVPVLVVPTNEELEIARQALAILHR